MSTGSSDRSTLEGVVQKLLPGGESLVQSNGISLLAQHGIPGDYVRVRELPRRRGVRRGEIVEVISPAPQRINAACPVAGECGGCALQFLNPDNHAREKSAWVEQSFRELIRSDTQWIPAEPQKSFAKRRRVQWQIGHDENGSFPGFFAAASHRLVRHESCMVLTTELQRLHQFLQQRNLQDMDAIQAIQLSDGMHVVLESNVEPDSALIHGIGVGIDIQWWWRSKGISRPLNRPVKRLHDELPAGIHSILLEIGPDDFVQGQFEGNRDLIRQIQIWSGQPGRIADLFCGAGNLSLPLATTSGAFVCGAELSEASVRLATRNARQLGIRGSFSTANLFETFNMEPYIGADVLILDPPRRGAKRICSNIQHLLPKKIIMVSCDPAAGARDGALLAAHGYQMKSLRAFDLFAYAGHVEAASLWEPA
ncbi:MAG TPA: methyltransferase [Mariprofundaceae bacterium]|nr:methyltransferase [Mariprofundaceae bacterium]